MASQAPQTTSKSSKRKSKLVDRTESPAPAPTVGKAPSVEGSDDDSAYTKELLKNIRNANKKLANTAKYDDIVKGHPGKTLDELVANKVINADQKAAILKKPNLQAQLAQLQDQLAQVKKIESDYRARIKTEKEEHEKALKDKYEAEKAEALEELRNEHKKAVDDGFLAVSQFLRLAAARRTEEADPNLEENQALEGVLLMLYTGDETAVEAMNKLVSGSQEQTTTTANEPLSVTYAQVKAAAEAYRAALFGEPQSDAEAAAAADTDPTIAHAGLTEINAGDTTTVAEAQETQASFASEPPKTEAVATTEPEAPVTENAELASSQLSEWEVVAAPREQETDSATPVPEQDKPETKEQDKPEAQEQEQAQAPADPAELQGSNSWADDHAAEPAAAASPQTDNEGFHQVQRRRGHGDGHGNWRGRGRGEGRGRGFRGDFRGRGRGYRHRGDYQGRGDYHGRGDHQGRGDYQGRPRRGGGES